VQLPPEDVDGRDKHGHDDGRLRSNGPLAIRPAEPGSRAVHPIVSTHGEAKRRGRATGRAAGRRLVLAHILCHMGASTRRPAGRRP
jgi:hypothetical protein